MNDVAFYKVGATTDSGPTVTACSVPAVAGTSVPITTGLYVGPSATYSGPYTDMDFTSSASCGTATCIKSTKPCTCQPTACVQIQAQTRGVRGLTCTAVSTQDIATMPPPRSAVYLDSYNNTIEDVHVEGFYDGVVVGDNPSLSVIPSLTTPDSVKRF